MDRSNAHRRLDEAQAGDPLSEHDISVLLTETGDIEEAAVFTHAWRRPDEWQQEPRTTKRRGTTVASWLDPLLSTPGWPFFGGARKSS